MRKRRSAWGGLALGMVLVFGSAIGCEKEPADTTMAQTDAPIETTVSVATKEAIEPTTEKATEPTTEAPTAPQDTAEKEALSQLLGLIDSAKNAIQKAVTDYNNNDLPSGHDHFARSAEIYREALGKLENLKDQAQKIKDLKKNAKEASDNYFGLTTGAFKNITECDDFIADYFSFGFESRPQLKDYKTIRDHYNALYTWNKQAKAVIDGIENVPQCLKVEWDNYEKAILMNDTIVNREFLAAEYNDWLRYHSALNLSTRYNTVEEKTFQALLAALKSEFEFSNLQIAKANDLAEEIRQYAEMDASDRADYDFEKITTNKINLKYEAVETIYPSLYNTYDAFVIIKTGCLSGTRSIVVEVEIPGFTQAFKQTINLDSGYRSIYIKPPILAGELNLTSSKNAQISVSIYEKDGQTLVQAQSFPVVIKSINDVEWSSDEFGISTQDNILCFLKPDADEIDQLKRKAINEISGMTNGKMQNLVGYQSNAYGSTYVGTYLQAAGIMRALYESGVRYDMSTFSVSGSHQRVRFPDEVLTKQAGLCVETSLVVASALQNAGMHAFLVFPPGHAQVAVEVWDQSYNPEGKHVGQGQYFLIETTCLSSSSNNNKIFVEYAQALLDGDLSSVAGKDYPIQLLSADQWKSYIQGSDVYILDCNDSRFLGLTEFYH
ncbi:MAG: hypothetical protein IKX10_06685 [Lachnospiraceae bacterium]|nr:hypothetical protein [Lachnospiraceae bacterium]